MAWGIPRACTPQLFRLFSKHSSCLSKTKQSASFPTCWIPSCICKTVVSIFGIHLRVPNNSKQFPQWPPFLDDVRWRSRLVLKFRVFTLKDIDEYRSHKLIIWTILFFFIFCYSKNAIRSKTSCLIFFKMIFVKINLWSCSIKRLQNSSALATLIDFDMEKVHVKFFSLHYKMRRMSLVIEDTVTFKTYFSSQIMHGFSWSFLFLLYYRKLITTLTHL